MRKLIISISLLIVALTAVTASADEKYYNPGYFETPGFIAIGGTTVYQFSSTHRDKEVRPHILGMYNLIQSEYGNLGLSLAAFYTTPSRTYNMDGLGYRIEADQYTGELGLNYFTASKSFNFWLGAGYNISYVEAELHGVKNYNTGSAKKSSKSFNDTVYGWNYYMGFEYVITKDGHWGLYFLFRGQESHRAKFNVNNTYVFEDGSSIAYDGPKSTMNISNKTYTFGLIYHF